MDSVAAIALRAISMGERYTPYGTPYQRPSLPAFPSVPNYGAYRPPYRVVYADTEGREGWLSRAEREALWERSRAEVNLNRHTHVTMIQRDTRSIFWGINMSRCNLTWNEMRQSETPPQFILLYNSRTGEHDCHVSFDAADQSWMD